MENIEEFISSKGVRPTAMRILVFRFMMTSKTAKTLSDIENAFAKSERTTLYRTLKTFEKKGIVHPIDDGTGVIKYALCAKECKCELERDLHLHFRCTNCKETQCLTEHKIPKINLPDGYYAKDVNLVVKGICPNCKSL